MMVLKKAFDKTVVDLAWSADGRTLLCASLDGSVLAAAFDPTELGDQVSAAEMGGILRGMYGEHSVGRSAAQGATQLAEDPLVLDYEAAAGAAHTVASTPADSPIAPSPASARAVAVAVRSSPLGAAAASSSPAAAQVSNQPGNTAVQPPSCHGAFRGCSFARVRTALALAGRCVCVYGPSVHQCAWAGVSVVLVRARVCECASELSQTSIFSTNRLFSSRR